MSGAKSELLAIARVLKSNGADGEILLSFRDFDPEDLDTKEPVFINFDGLPVPFFIESFSKRGSNRALVRITGVSNLNDAEELIGKDFLVDKDTVIEESDDVLTLDDLVGWTVLDDDDNKVGTISGLEDIPGNPCLYVDTKNGQKIIPYHEDLVLSIDEKAKEIGFSIPEGLL